MKNQPNRELFSRTPASVRFFFDEFACVGDTRIEAKNRSSHRTIRRELSRQFFHDRVSKRDSEARSTGPGRDVFQRGELENARQRCGEVLERTIVREIPEGLLAECLDLIDFVRKKVISENFGKI